MLQQAESIRTFRKVSCEPKCATLIISLKVDLNITPGKKDC